MRLLEQILVLGAGPSSCVPHVACLMETPARCLACLDAAGRLDRSAEYTAQYGGPPPGCSTSRNKRTNPSAVLRYRRPDGSLGSILLDCGKSFYSNTAGLLKAGIRELDAVLLTHGHADAALGLDDLRHWSGAHPAIQPSVPIWCDQETFTGIQVAFPYLVDPKQATGAGAVPALSFNVFTPGDAIQVGGLAIQTVRVLHGAYSDGRPYYANGFICEGLTYLSDLSAIPPESARLLHEAPNDIIIIDCLYEERAYPSHFNWPQARALCQQLCPKLTVLVGMSHHIEYYRFQRHLDDKFGFPLHPKGIVGQLEYAKGRTLVGFDGLLLSLNSSAPTAVDVQSQ